MQGRPADEREEDGLLAVGGGAELVGQHDLGLRQRGPQPLQEQRVAAAAAGHREEPDPGGLDVAGDRADRELGERAHDVGDRDLASLCREVLLHVGEVEVLLAGALRRGEGVVGVREHGVQQRLVDPSGPGDRRIVVIAERVEIVRDDDRVDQRVRGADVVGDEAVRADDGHVRDATEVQRRRDAGAAAEQQLVEERHERRAVAARGDVADTDVGDDGRTGLLGDPGGLPDLQGAERVRAVDPVVHGLAVRAHRVDAADLRRDVGRHVGERLPDEGVEFGHLGQGGLRRGQRGDEACPQLGIVGDARGGEHRAPEVDAVRREAPLVAKSTTAASIPSCEVPEISPRTRISSPPERCADGRLLPRVGRWPRRGPPRGGS